jgi:signal peptidase I
MSTGNVNGRKPWVAIVLSLLATGLGHIYCGRIVTGLALFLASSLFAPLAFLASLLEPSTLLLLGLLGAALGVVGLYLFAVVDAFALARRLRDDYVLREFNRGPLYALFILVGVTYPPGVVHYLRANAFEAFLVPTASEAPNILPGDRVLVNKQLLHQRYPRRGDVVVFRTPRQPGRQWIQRIIALPGDRVALRQNEVFVNGKKLEHERVPSESLPELAGAVQGDVVQEVNGASRYLILLDPAEKSVDFADKEVPDASCFLLGDNRNHASDSRQFGFIPLGDLRGAFQYIYCPAGSWSRFGAYHAAW